MYTILFIHEPTFHSIFYANKTYRVNGCWCMYWYYDIIEVSPFVRRSRPTRHSWRLCLRNWSQTQQAQTSTVPCHSWNHSYGSNGFPWSRCWSQCCSDDCYLWSEQKHFRESRSPSHLRRAAGWALSCPHHSDHPDYCCDCQGRAAQEHCPARTAREGQSPACPRVWHVKVGAAIRPRGCGWKGNCLCARLSPAESVPATPEKLSGGKWLIIKMIRRNHTYQFNICVQW